jgi:hypothetical protein
MQPTHPTQFTQPMHPTHPTQPTFPRPPRIPLLPTIPALAATAADIATAEEPATAALPTTAAEFATAALPTTPAELTTAALPTTAVERVTATLPALMPGTVSAVPAARRLEAMLWAFVPIAALVTITPGAATAMVVRSAMRGGWRSALLTTAGNEIGVVVWALLSVAGISALVAASEVAFLALKIVGAVVLIHLGAQSLRRGVAGVAREPSPRRRRALRDGLLTSL